MAPPAPANIRVLVRVRPLNHSELKERGSVGRVNVLHVDTKSNSKIDFNGENKENGATIGVNSVNVNETNSINTQYMFDAVHGENSTQTEVYDSVKGIVDAVTAGYNGTIVAYGQTGSGKTHTVFGSGVRCDESGSGLVQRSLRDIFNATQGGRTDVTMIQDGDDEGAQIQSSRTTFKGSFFEIFNERIYDLLASESLEKTLAVRENTSGVYVEGLKEVEVQNLSDVEDLLANGLANRHVASTNMNRTSSRSHALFVLKVKTEDVTRDGLRKVRTSKFTLVDLAGSERQKNTATFGNRLKEASAINKSLSCLGKVINALVDREHGKASHVPFRDSKLTFLLKDTWGGNSKTCLVATVSPSGHARSETISTLTFAQRAKLVKNNAILNEDTCGTIAALQAEVEKLRSKLQESSSATSLDCLSQNIGANVDRSEIITSLHRRHERAERKCAELEKRVSDENELVRSLKRKLQEECMVRKFKERRLEYYQRKDIGQDRNDQIELMEKEITLLQRRLDTPSTDAVEWRVAYEETKEALDVKMQEGQSDVGELEETKARLEETVDRLCSEKFELEGKVIDLTSSSKETRREIESIMKEVDNLEREMISCQEQLRRKSDQCDDYMARAGSAERSLEEARSRVVSTQEEMQQLQIQMTELQTTATARSRDIASLTDTLNTKSSEYLELEALVKENELELESNIVELKEKLKSSEGSLIEKDAAIKDLENQQRELLSNNESLSTQLREALLEVTTQSNLVSSLEKKLTVISEEKDNAIDAARKEFELKEIHLNDELQTHQSKLEAIAGEKENLEARLSCVKEQLDMNESRSEALTRQIQELEQSHESEVQTAKQKIQDLTAEIAQYRKDIDSLSQSESHTKEENLKLEKIARDAKESFKQTEVELSKLRLELSRLESDQKSSSHDKASQIEKLELQKKTIEEEHVRLKQENESLSDTGNRIKNELATLNDQYTLLQEEKSNLQLERESLQEDNQELAKMNKALNDLQDKRNTLCEEKDGKIGELEQKLKSAESEYAILQESKETLLQTRELETNDMIHEVETLRAEVSQHKVDLDRLRESEALANEEKSSLITNAKKHDIAAKETQAKLSEALTALKDLEERQKASGEQKDAKIAELEEKLKTFEVEYAALQRSRDELLKGHEADIQSNKSEIEALQTEIVQYKKDLKGLSSLEAEAKDHKNAAEEAGAKLSEAEAALVHLEEKQKAQCEEKDMQIGCLEQKLHSIEADLVDMKKQALSNETAQEECLKWEKMANENESLYNNAQSKIAGFEEALSQLENKHWLLCEKKDAKIKDLKMKLKALVSDCKQHDVVRSKAKDECAALEDQLTLLKRAKKNIEFERDSLQEDQDELLKKNQSLTNENEEIKIENERLKRDLDDFMNRDDKSAKSGSTWGSDSKLSYDMSAGMNLRGPSETINDAKDEGDELDDDDSFDESLFLPNIEGQSDADDDSTTDTKDALNKETINKTTLPTIQEANKENENANLKPPISISTTLTSTTPSKKDYGKRRLPLSERKQNITPNRPSTKRARSWSSAKKSNASNLSRANYMVFDNKKLFEA